MLIFVMMIAVLVGILQVLNWMPSAIQVGAFQKYANIEELRSHLKIGIVYTPAYFPRNVRWPPSLVAAQTRPYPAVVMEFTNSDAPGETILVITQTALPHPPLAEKLRLAEVRETVRFPFKEREALLEAGVCQNDDPCSRMTWHEGVFRLSLVMRSSPADLVRIAESMVISQPVGSHAR